MMFFEVYKCGTYWQKGTRSFFMYLQVAPFKHILLIAGLQGSPSSIGPVEGVSIC